MRVPAWRFGAAVGQVALRGYPIMVYYDHNMGESSGATGTENGLYRTLANLRMMDDALLVHFNRVDVIGLSGGTERFYHFMMFHRGTIGPGGGFTSHGLTVGFPVRALEGVREVESL